MKKFLYPIEKLLLLLVYLELLILIDKKLYLIIANILLLLSIKFQGSKPYTPLLFFILILQFFQVTFLQLVFILALGLIMMFCSFYDINVPEKGKYSIGHMYHSIQSTHNPESQQKLELSIFYPAQEGKKGKKVEWIPNKQYQKALYEIFYVDPKTRRMPFGLFKFALAYLHKVWMPVQGGVPYFFDKENNNKNKVIIFSHGLGGNMNCYSSICGSLASQGYIVVCPNHIKDEICIDYRVVSEKDPELILNYLFEKRHRDLLIRKKELLSIIQELIEKEMCKELHEEMKVEEIILAGQSYGGGSILETKAQINKTFKEEKKRYFNKIICLDPWLFPLKNQQYQNLKNENILIINSHRFYEQVPEAYHLEEKLKQLHNNSPQMNAFMIRQLDHIGQSDMAYVFGNLLQFLNIIKVHYLSDKFMKLNQMMSKSFLQGKAKKQILDQTNEFCALEGMDKAGVIVKEEYRFTRELTLSKNC